MSSPPDHPAPADLTWTDQGAPRSQRFDDIYFSTEDGLAETRAVFLHGCGLPQAWAGRRHFTVGELGFGTGLNILALLQLWRQARAPGQTLSIFSVEAFPLSRDEAERALAAWPELADLTAMLLAAWPRRAPGFHRLDFPGLGASLDLAIGDAAWALEQWGGRADAWFLDGFSPATNPQMWRDEVLAGVARCSAPGARLATFTVAGAVRRGLQAQGFIVEKHPGHGRKRERLEAYLPGAEPQAAAMPRVAVIGAGIAGAALARAFAALGCRPIVFDPGGPGAGASGNPAALVAPALDAGGGARARLYAQAFARAVDLYRPLGPAAVISRGVLQLEHGERDPARFDAVMAGGLFEEGALRRLDAAEAGARLGRPGKAGALDFVEGLAIRPAAVLEAWLGGDLQPGRVASVDPADGGWTLRDADGGTLAQVDLVCVAAGSQAAALLPDDAPCALGPVRGQASWGEGLELATPAAWGGYAIPFDGRVLFGATHDRGRDDDGLDPADHQRNLAVLAQALPQLAARAAAGALQGRASVRAATPDRMPLAGAAPGAPGLYLLAGLGSRGFTTAPLLAEHVAALALGVPSPLPANLQALADPARQVRAAKKVSE